MNDSINPANMKKGTKPITIFNPLMAPILNEANLEYVPGNKMLLPIIKPAAAAITIEVNSIVPCNMITGNPCESWLSL